jgi:hypothetical protein
LIGKHPDSAPCHVEASLKGSRAKIYKKRVGEEGVSEVGPNFEIEEPPKT